MVLYPTPQYFRFIILYAYVIPPIKFIILYAYVISPIKFTCYESGMYNAGPLKNILALKK